MLEFFRMARAERKFENTGKSLVELVREGWKKAGGKAIYKKELQCKEESKYQVVFERKYDSAIAAELACRMEPWVMSFLRGREIDFSTIDSHIAYGFFNFIKTCRIEYTDKNTGEVKETHLFDTDKSIIAAIQNSIKCKIDQSNRKEIFKYRPGYTGTERARGEKLDELLKIIQKTLNEYPVLHNYKNILIEIFDRIKEANKVFGYEIIKEVDKKGRESIKEVACYKILVEKEVNSLIEFLKTLGEFRIKGKAGEFIPVTEIIKNWLVSFNKIREKYKEVCKETSYNEPIYGKDDEESGEIGDFIPDVEPTPEDRCIERDEVNQLCIKYSESEFGKILLEIIIDSGSNGKLSVKELKEQALHNQDFIELIAPEFGLNPEDDFELSEEQEEKLHRKIKLFYRGLRKRLKIEFQLN